MRCARGGREAHALDGHLARELVPIHAVKGDDAGHKLPDDDTEAVQVALVRVALTQQHLGRDPLQRAHARHRVRVVHLAA